MFFRCCLFNLIYEALVCAVAFRLNINWALFFFTETSFSSFRFILCRCSCTLLVYYTCIAACLEKCVRRHAHMPYRLICLILFILSQFIIRKYFASALWCLEIAEKMDFSSLNKKDFQAKNPEPQKSTEPVLSRFNINLQRQVTKFSIYATLFSRCLIGDQNVKWKTMIR